MQSITTNSTVIGLSVVALALGLSACGGGAASTSSDPLAAHHYGSPSVNDYVGMDVHHMVPTYVEQLRSESKGVLQNVVGEATFYCAVTKRSASDREVVLGDLQTSQIGNEKGKVKQRLNFDHNDINRVTDNALAGTPDEGTTDPCKMLPHLTAAVPQQAVS